LGRLDGLVNDLLDVARLDAGVFELRPAVLDLTGLVRECAGMLATPEHPVHVSTQSEGAILVSGDASRLRQCLENIVANAVQKSPDRAEVAVTVLRERQANGVETALVEVIDQGPGIPAEILPFVFDRFYSSRPDRRAGLGL